MTTDVMQETIMVLRVAESELWLAAEHADSTSERYVAENKRKVANEVRRFRQQLQEEANKVRWHMTDLGRLERWWSSSETGFADPRDAVADWMKRQRETRAAALRSGPKTDEPPVRLMCNTCCGTDLVPFPEGCADCPKAATTTRTGRETWKLCADCSAAWDRITDRLPIWRTR